MMVIITIFAIIISYDLQRFIRKKERARVFIIYIFFMASSLAVSLLLAAGKRPESPSRWIEEILKMMKVVK